MANSWNDDRFDVIEKSILWFLYKRPSCKDARDDYTILAQGLNVDKALITLNMAKLMNDGWVARVVDLEGRERYALSLEGFEYMKSKEQKML